MINKTKAALGIETEAAQLNLKTAFDDVQSAYE